MNNYPDNVQVPRLVQCLITNKSAEDFIVHDVYDVHVRLTIHLDLDGSI